jgi:hypothetical protein
MRTILTKIGRYLAATPVNAECSAKGALCLKTDTLHPCRDAELHLNLPVLVS